MIPSAPIRLTDNSGPEIRATPVEAAENKRSTAAKQSWEKRRSEKSVQEAEADRKRQRYEAQGELGSQSATIHSATPRASALTAPQTATAIRDSR